MPKRKDPDKKKPRRKKAEREEPVSLHPLEFGEAVSDLLKVKPKKKGADSRRRTKRRKKE